MSEDPSAGARIAKCIGIPSAGIFLIALVLLVAAARSSASEIPGSPADLSALFRVIPPPQARRTGARTEVRRFPVYRAGVTRDAMVLEAPVRIRAPLAGFSGRVMLNGSASHLYNIGDGLQLEIVLLQQGTGRIVFSRYIDPGRKAEDRSWIPIKAAMELGGSKDAEIEIRLSAGPQGDLTADWLGIASLELTNNGAR